MRFSISGGNLNYFISKLIVRSNFVLFYLLVICRHEIAFILGQLADPHSIPALVEVLKRTEESPMVRHEAAEALGGIPTDELSSEGGVVLQLLREWATKKDAPDVVRDSCVVAVDMWEASRFEPTHLPITIR